jgi:hypothetical protein
VLPAALRAELERLVAVMPWLLKLPGVGPISAAQVLVSRSHAARLRSEAAFVALAGANSIPACSGQVTRHRLNLGGDRQLNRALHTIVVARLRDELTPISTQLVGATAMPDVRVDGWIVTSVSWWNPSRRCLALPQCPCGDQPVAMPAGKAAKAIVTGPRRAWASENMRRYQGRTRRPVTTSRSRHREHMW